MDLFLTTKPAFYSTTICITIWLLALTDFGVCSYICAFSRIKSSSSHLAPQLCRMVWPKGFFSLAVQYSSLQQSTQVLPGSQCQQMSVMKASRHSFQISFTKVITRTRFSIDWWFHSGTSHLKIVSYLFQQRIVTCAHSFSVQTDNLTIV